MIIDILVPLAGTLLGVIVGLIFVEIKFKEWRKKKPRITEIKEEINDEETSP